MTMGRGYRPHVTFDVAADAYASFMGRFAAPLAEQFVDLVGFEPGNRVLDVGCGPGTVTAVLAQRLGSDHGRRCRPVTELRARGA